MRSGKWKRVETTERHTRDDWMDWVGKGEESGKRRQRKARQGKGRTEGGAGEERREGEGGGDGMDNASIRAKERDRAEGQQKEALMKGKTRSCPIRLLFLSLLPCLYFLTFFFDDAKQHCKDGIM